MRTVTDGFLAALRYPHVVIHEVTAYPPVGTARLLEVESGSITLDRTASVRRTATLTVTNRDASTGEDIASAALIPYGTEVLIRKGIRFADGTEELVRLGRFRLEQVNANVAVPGAELTLSDRSAEVADTQLVAPKRYRGTAVIEDAIEDLILDVYPTATVNLPGSADTFGKTTVVDQDRWQAITDFSKAIGCETYIDADDTWQVAPIPDPSAGTAVWDINGGPVGVLTDLHVVADRTNVKNGVVVTGHPLQKHAPVHVLVTDDNVDSPTMWGGAFGMIPDYLDSDLIRTNAQGTAAGQARLNDLLGQARTLNLASVPNPALEPGDAITVTYVDGTSEQHLIDVVTISLGVEDDMTIQTRSTTLFPSV